jgi:hypothetical protein
MIAINDLAWTVEEACLNAWPSPRQIMLEGWLLRASGGETRRTNSVNPLRFGPRDPTRVIDAAEEIYRTLRQPALFRVPSIVPEMDGPLAQRGYLVQAEIYTTLFFGLDDQGPVDFENVEISNEPGEAWFAARAVGSTLIDPVYRTIVEAIVLPKAFASRHVEGNRSLSLTVFCTTGFW